MNIPDATRRPASPPPGLEIIDDNFPAGTLGFSATNYSVVESAGLCHRHRAAHQRQFRQGFCHLSRHRTDSPTIPACRAAVAGVDYTSTSGTLNFTQRRHERQLSTSRSQLSPPCNPTSSSTSCCPAPHRRGQLSTPTSPPILVTNAVVTIVDNHFQPGHLSLTGTAYSVTKGGTATVAVQRTGGALGTVSVAVPDPDGTGSNGVNYRRCPTG